MTEEWRPIPLAGWHYEASSLGRIRSLHGGRVRIRAPFVNHDGYERMGLSHGGKNRLYAVNRLVCMAFHGPPKDGEEAAHLDGIRRNNKPENLAWVSHRENVGHREGHGTVLHGEAHPRAILTAAQAAEAWLSPLFASELADMFGVSVGAICDVRKSKNWREVTAALPAQPSRRRSTSQPKPIPVGFREAFASGLRGARLAEMFGASRSLVWKWGKAVQAQPTKARSAPNPLISELPV